MRNAALHRQLEAFTVEASGRLGAELSGGAEMPFEIDEERSSGRASLYCYRPLTGLFIQRRLGVLSALETWEQAAGALVVSDALAVYLEEQGEGRAPSEPRAQAHAVLATFLGCVFSERTDFGFEPAHFEAAYADLERALYDGHCTATIVAPVLGVALDPDTIELSLGEGLSLIRGDALPDAPADAVWGEAEEPQVLAVLAVDQERSAGPPVAVARRRFRPILTALRLFERGGYGIGPVGWARTEAGSWRPIPVGASRRVVAGPLLTLVRAAQEDELRAFCDLVTRRPPGGGELSWALSRFEMGCERLIPSEALSDYLMALRALLEPEGPSSGRLAPRLAVICARPEDRGALAERTARAITLEREVITGIAPSGPGIGTLVDELGQHLRAILRDALCGHLDADLRSVADELLADAAGEIDISRRSSPRSGSPSGRRPGAIA